MLSPVSLVPVADLAAERYQGRAAIVAAIRTNLENLRVIREEYLQEVQRRIASGEVVYLLDPLDP